MGRLQHNCFKACSVAKIRNRGLRLTRPRLAVLDCLDDDDSGLTPKTLFEKVSQQVSETACDPVTIYRIIDAFTALGIIHRLPDGRIIACREEHHASEKSAAELVHFIITCRNCQLFEERILPQRSQRELSHLLEQSKSAFKLPQTFQGETLCPSCAAITKELA